MPPTVTTIKRDGRAATVHLEGDLMVSSARGLYNKLRTVARRRGLRTVVLDFTAAGRLDSAGLAVVSLVARELRRGGKQLDLVGLNAQHRAAIELLPEPPHAPLVPATPRGRLRGAVDGVRGAVRNVRGAVRDVIPEGAVHGVIEQLGGLLLEFADSARAFGRLVRDTLYHLGSIISGRSRMPAGALRQHLEIMGVEGVFIVGLMSFLTGMTMAFQGAVQLQRFGAGVFVADMIGLSMVRELVPLMTAVIITGRTGAAIAAELGTMQVRSEIDALSTMGISPVRFLIVPRMVAITIIGPSLTLIGIFIGILGGMLVASATLDLPAVTFWTRVTDAVVLRDFIHGVGKSLVFAWLIGFIACHMGMRAGSDASSVGSATTRTVVTSVFMIILVDAVFATLTTLLHHGGGS
jgi:phospholipid/cholesterol/gamma-HCH transport system permease protein